MSLSLLKPSGRLTWKQAEFTAARSKAIGSSCAYWSRLRSVPCRSTTNLT
jgi:hypothetical protein